MGVVDDFASARDLYSGIERNERNEQTFDHNPVIASQWGVVNGSKKDLIETWEGSVVVGLGRQPEIDSPCGPCRVLSDVSVNTKSFYEETCVVTSNTGIVATI